MRFKGLLRRARNLANAAARYNERDDHRRAAASAVRQAGLTRNAALDIVYFALLGVLTASSFRWLVHRWR
jgi:hypothetical protein